MTAYLEQRTSRAAGWSRRIAAFSAVLLLTAVGAHNFGLLETPGFLWVLGLVAMLAATALLCSVHAFARLWSFGDRGGFDLTVGALTALVVLSPFLFALWLAATRPMLHDVSTDLDDPPSLEIARGAIMNPITPYTAAVRLLITANYPQVTGRRYELPFEQTVDAVNALMARQGWRVTGPAGGSDVDEMTVNALASTWILALPVDVSVRVTDEGATSYVDMRSASRYGRHDLGDNAARISSFLEQLDAEIAAQAGTVPVE